MEIRGKAMGGEKRSPVRLIANDGAERFAGREKESAIVDASKNRKTSVEASVIKRLSPQADHGNWDVVEDSDTDVLVSGAAIHDFRMSFASFVETKFVPEHVQYKTRSGQTHYQAMLKHVITPEAVSRIFNAENGANARLRAIPGWPYLDGTRICDLRPEHIRRIVAAADSDGYSAQTVKHIKNVCFAIIAHAQREGCFNGPNPASLVKLPKLTRSTLPALSTAQVKSILDLLHYPHREAALFALTTSMSLPEICDLRWKHVNLEQSEQIADGRRLPAQALLVRAWWNPAGLGDSRASTKSKIVEIREPLLSTLRELRQKRPVADPEDLVLLSHAGDKIIPAGFWVSELKRVAKILGISRLTWQDLRRTHQVLQAELLISLSRSTSWSGGSISANWGDKQAPSRLEDLCERQYGGDSNVHRRSCFGRRQRVSSEPGVRPAFQE